MTDSVFIARAIGLARQGAYTTDPNPRVGCVLVREGRVVGEGWHRRAGEAHAEVEALRRAGSDARGATAYVTLEPCSHHGKTPPCCEALIAAGVTRVVAAMEDPNPRVSGRGLRRLEEAGVETRCGLLEEDAEALNPGFCKRMRSGLPFVVSKLAMSLDGRTAMASGESKWITGEAARRDVHRLRAASSAILTGVATVLADDPSLNARLDDAGVEVVQPLRIIVDSALRTPPTARMTALPGRNIILTCAPDNDNARRLQDAGFEIYRLPAGGEGRVDLPSVWRCLGDLELNQVMVEAGATLNGALLAGGLVDEWVVYMAPVVLGDAARGLFHLPGVTRMAQAMPLRLIDVRPVGADLRLHFRPA